MGRDRRADAEPHARHSMVLVPMDTPGVDGGAQHLPIMHHHRAGRALRDRASRRAGAGRTFVGEEGRGFAMAQARLGPGRMHHCMRTHRPVRAGARADVRARLRARDVRQEAAEQANVRNGSRSRAWRSTRRGSWCCARRGGWTARAAEAPRNDVAMIKVVGRACRPRWSIARDAGLRRHGPDARHAAGPALDLGPRAAVRRRARRGPSAHRRARRAGARPAACRRERGAAAPLDAGAGALKRSVPRPRPRSTVPARAPRRWPIRRPGIARRWRGPRPCSGSPDRKKPPTISLASANGPSTTCGRPPRTRTRAASACDFSDSLAMSRPRSFRPCPKSSMRP